MAVYFVFYSVFWRKKKIFKYIYMPNFLLSVDYIIYFPLLSNK